MTLRAPSRRQLATVMDRDIAPAVNALSNNTDWLKRELDRHWERMETMDGAAHRFREMGFWARMRWIVWGMA